jgi:hypothetical protein
MARQDKSGGRYTVIIEVFEHGPDAERLMQSEQCVAAVSVVQAIRRAGMKFSEEDRT